MYVIWAKTLYNPYFCINFYSLNNLAWWSHILLLVETINYKISTGDSDSIDLTQCGQNSRTFSEALSRFQNAFTKLVAGMLSAREFVDKGIDSWKYFTDNKVGDVEGCRSIYNNTINIEKERVSLCFSSWSVWYQKDLYFRLLFYAW